MLTLDEALERLNDRAMDIIDEYKDLGEFYIDDERTYMERKAYLDEKKENLRQKNLGKKQSKETIEKRSPKLRGENSGTAKLKNQDILEIRRLVNENIKTRKEVAKMYNMNYTTICKIINKQLWGHI